MSIQVDRFLGGFTENAPRPPVPGEENEQQSTGGTSTRSSSSHKSQVSAKSHTSQRSDASVAGTPRRSNLDKSHHEVSTTKLRTKEDEEAPLGFEPEGSAASSPPFTENNTPPYLKWAENLQLLLNDREGVRLFKQFLDQEHSAQPLDFWFACRGLKIGVQSDDHAKIQSLVKLIYKKYIKGDQLKLRQEVKKGITDKLKREVYEQGIFDAAQSDIEDAMRSDTYPLFLKSDLYVQYVQTGGESPKTTSNTSSGSNSVRPMSSGPLPTVPEDGELKQEDIKKSQSSTVLPLTSSNLLTTAQIRSKEKGSFFRMPEGFPLASKHNRSAHAAGSSSAGGAYNDHVSYAPVSQWESEVQSLGSSELTESDTMSLTDSSVDGRDVPRGSRRWKKNQRYIKQNADYNKHTGLNQQLIPRTDRVLKDRNTAETDPEKFAAMLIERLEKVKAKLEEPERMREMLKHVESDPLLSDSSTKHMMSKSQLNSSSLNASSCSQSAMQQQNMNMSLLMAALAPGEYQENDQSILDDHVSRIWRDNSQGQTPSLSPPGGRHSPDRPPGTAGYLSRAHIAGPSPNVSALLHSSFTGPLNKSLGAITASSSGSHKRSKDLANMSASGHLLSLQSFDSGMGVDERSLLGVAADPESAHHKHIHHYHHHHHHISKDKIRQLTSHVMPAALAGYTPYGLDTSLTSGGQISSGGGSRGGKDRSSDKRGSGKRSSDANSNIDSGIYDLPPTVPNLRDPANEKVLNWMLENDKVSTGTAQYSTDNSDKGSSHKRSSHKSTSSSHNKSSSSKKTSYERSASLDRSSHHHGNAGTAMNRSVDMSQLPQQPIMQDPSLPLLNPPNPTVQLEEVTRRLQDEKYYADMRAAAAAHRSSHRGAASAGDANMAKSKSFTSGMGSASLSGGGAKDKVPSSRSGGFRVPHNIPLGSGGRTHEVSSSTEDLSNSSFRSDRSRSASRKPGTSTTSAPAPDVTVVGYYFCSEPIPYRTTLHGANITLSQFKNLVTKKGNYRYFFKKPSDEFDSGVVYEEVVNDTDVLPLCDGKIIGKVDKVE